MLEYLCMGCIAWDFCINIEESLPGQYENTGYFMYIFHICTEADLPAISGSTVVLYTCYLEENTALLRYDILHQ